MLTTDELRELATHFKHYIGGPGLLARQAADELLAMHEAVAQVVDLEGLEAFADKLDRYAVPPCLEWAKYLRALLAALQAGVRETCCDCGGSGYAPLSASPLQAAVQLAQPKPPPCPTCHGTGGPVVVLALSGAEEAGEQP